MLGIEYLLAFVKIAFQVAFAIVSAIPFHLSWNLVVPIYFSKWIPEQFYNIPFWHFVAIILVFNFVGEQIQKITPKFVSIEQKVEQKKEN